MILDSHVLRLQKEDMHIQLRKREGVRMSMVLSKEPGVWRVNEQCVEALSTGKQSKAQRPSKSGGHGCEEEAR